MKPAAKKIGFPAVHVRHAMNARECIKKAEAGSLKPMLKVKGLGWDLEDRKKDIRNFRANYDMAFGKTKR